MQTPPLWDMYGWKVNNIIDTTTQGNATSLQFFRACWEDIKRRFYAGSLEDYWGEEENLYHVYYMNWEIIFWQAWEEGDSTPLNALYYFLFEENLNKVKLEPKQKEKTKMKYTMTRQHLEDMIAKARYDMLDCITLGMDYQRRWYAAYTAKTDPNFPAYSFYYQDRFVEISKIYKKLKSLPSAETYEMSQEELESYSYSPTALTIKALAPELPESD